MNIITKVVAGGPGRKSRFHTETGDLLPIRELRHLPRALAEFARTRLTKERPEQPWWPISAIKIAEEILQRRPARIIEFGSGSSTIWLARRAEAIYSIEDNPAWADRTRTRCEKCGLGNVDIQYRKGERYWDLQWARDRGLSFDFAVVDGSYRWRCIESVLPLMTKHAVIYLDNSDADKD